MKLVEMKKQAFDALTDAELVLACTEPAVSALQGKEGADKASVIRSLHPDQQQVFMIRLLYPACHSEPDFQAWIRYLLDTPGYWQGVQGGLHFWAKPNSFGCWTKPRKRSKDMSPFRARMPRSLIQKSLLYMNNSNLHSTTPCSGLADTFGVIRVHSYNSFPRMPNRPNHGMEADAEMATIYKEIWIEASPELVWDVVRDAGAVHKRFVPDYTAETYFDGVNRLIHFSNGNIVKELIVTRDDERRRMAYAVVETKMPLQHHHASFQVFEDSGGRCRLVWITDFCPISWQQKSRSGSTGGRGYEAYY